VKTWRTARIADMTAMPFDTLKLADRLQAGGFSAEQARITASALAEVVADADVATKADLQQTEIALRADIRQAESGLKGEIQQLRADMGHIESGLKGEIQPLRVDMGHIESGLRSYIQTVETGLKADIEKVETGLKADIRKVGTGLTSEINQLRSEAQQREFRMEAEIAGAKNETLRWMMTFALAQIGAIVALLKLLP
jgi:hypothetical protein